MKSMISTVPQRRFLRLGPKPRYKIPDGSIVYAIGDIHGCLGSLEHLLEAIARDCAGRSARSHLVFLGDLVDRGPQSKAVVERLRNGPFPTDEVHFIMGNHEEVMLDCYDGMIDQLIPWLKYGGLQTLESYGLSRSAILAASANLIPAIRAAIPARHIAFLRSFADQVRLGDYLFVHAGIRPGIPVEDQSSRDLRWIRQGFLESRADHGAMIVHGHTIVGEVQVRKNRIAVDTGCYAGGPLSAVVLQEDRTRAISVNGLSPADPD